MPKKDQTQTVNVDPATQAFQDQYLRPGAAQAAAALRGLPQFGPESYLGFVNPYESGVIDSIRGDFDRQRQFALGQGLDQATQAGAGRGSRGAVLQAQLVGDVNRNETGTIAALRNQNFDRANQLAMAMQQLQRSGILAPLQALNMGIGATGTQTTQQGDFLGGLLGNVAGLGGIAGGLGWSPFGGGD